MTLEIDNPEADKLAQELAKHTGEAIPQAVIAALRERFERTKKSENLFLADDFRRIGRECAALPVLDARTPDEILGYDGTGVPA